MPNSNGPRQGTRNKLANHPRDSGASPPQRSIQEFEEDSKVHLKIDPSVPDGQFHPRFNGHTGTVVGKQGRAFQIEISDKGKTKKLIVNPAHLKAQE